MWNLKHNYFSHRAGHFNYQKKKSIQIALCVVMQFAVQLKFVLSWTPDPFCWYGDEPEDELLDPESWL